VSPNLTRKTLPQIYRHFREHGRTPPPPLSKAPSGPLRSCSPSRLSPITSLTDAVILIRPPAPSARTRSPREAELGRRSVVQALRWSWSLELKLCNYVSMKSITYCSKAIDSGDDAPDKYHGPRACCPIIGHPVSRK